MTPLSDQFSAVRQAQLEAQFDFFNSITTQAIESASRVAALNLAASRDVVQRSLGAGFALMNARDPRDVLSFGGQAGEQVRSLFDYSRELLGIASAVRPYAVRPLAPAPGTQQAAETVEVVARSVAAPVQAPADAVTEAAHAVTEPVAAASAEPVVVAEPPSAAEPLAAMAEPIPVAEPKAIAKAVGKGAPRAASASHPAAAPVALEEAEAPKIELPAVSPKRKR